MQQGEAARRALLKDPLARWFQQHFNALDAAGMLGNPYASGPESGCLPEVWNACSTCFQFCIASYCTGCKRHGSSCLHLHWMNVDGLNSGSHLVFSKPKLYKRIPFEARSFQVCLTGNQMLMHASEMLLLCTHTSVPTAPCSRLLLSLQHLRRQWLHCHS